jgi:hypothetical protein
MAGLVPAIHVLLQRGKKDVDGRHEAGHDVERADVRQFAELRDCAMLEADSRGTSPAMTTVRVDMLHIFTLPLPHD